MSVTQVSRSSQKTITVIQGDYAVSTDPNVIMSTVLGSCIAVCLFDPFAHIGGMNHFLLAQAADAQNSDLKYGVNAMELLINRVVSAGGDRASLQAKLFGGARMTEHARDIGRNNADFALDFLMRESIPCVAQSLGGDKARRIQFTPTTGAARQLQISGTQPLLTAIKRPGPATENITLF